MLSDPWSRPTLEDLRRLEDNPPTSSRTSRVGSGRFLCRIPAELVSRRGNSISAMTREMGSTGATLIHKGSVPLGEARLRLASEQEELAYPARVESCVPCSGGLFRSEISIATDECPTLWP